MSDNKFKSPIQMAQLALDQGGEVDVTVRIFYMLEVIGRARLNGGLIVSETFLPGREVEILLDNLAGFARQLDKMRQHFTAGSTHILIFASP